MLSDGNVFLVISALHAGELYVERTLADGIAQWTHQEIRGGGKYPSTTHVVLLLSHTLFA